MSIEIKKNHPHASLEGQLLVASPPMDDPVFTQSVILVLQHSQHGAVGVILNRPFQQEEYQSVEVAELLRQVRNVDSLDGILQHGGPIDGPLIAISRIEDAPPQDTTGLNRFSRHPQQDESLKTTSQSTKLFVGHAGWTSGQLEQEIRSGCWLTAPAPVHFLELDPQEMWITALRESGLGIYRETLGIRHIPQDVCCN